MSTSNPVVPSQAPPDIAAKHQDDSCGTNAALARVVAVFGAAQPRVAYMFANKRANRIKVLVHDGLGIWLAVLAALRNR